MVEQIESAPIVLTGGIEPYEVGTRIEDGRGREWLRVLPPGGAAPWWLVAADQRHADSWSVWSAIPEPTRFIRPSTEGGEDRG